MGYIMLSLVIVVFHYTDPDTQYQIFIPFFLQNLKKLKSKKMLLDELSETKSEKRANRIMELIALLENK